MSSGGGLAQLVAYGAQDVALTGNPQTSMFIQRYKRHTQYAVESIRQTLMGTVEYGGSGTVILSRSGDMICGLMAEVTMQYNGAPDPLYPAEAFFDSIELKIGGQRIDWLPHNWFRVYAQVYFNATQYESYQDSMNFTQEVAGQERTFYFPIPFFFSSMAKSLALPLIALQYHEVEVKFNYARQNQLYSVNTATPPKVQIYADYVFLDSQERIKFAQQPHEYLITQTQYTTSPILFSPTNQITYRIPLNFNHPCKFLAWATIIPNTHGRFTMLQGETNDNTAAPIASALIQLNGRDRFTERPGKYFKNANPWISQQGQYTTSGLYAYHFGLMDTLINPNSGTLNFSRIDNATLILKTKIADLAFPVVAGTNTTEQQTYVNSANLTTVEIFAYNYNILRIMSGMGGLAYAN
ncbi:major capsid protein VP54 [Acanthocystis turfacea Chlorella virus MN0810.1]|nr:major capsid protein VP54 [Acanthocystis turfacea Chlorella virus MN0810.1]